MNLIKNKSLLVVVLPLAAFTFLFGAGISAGINSEAVYTCHSLKYLPGTPKMKNGYEFTSDGVRPVIRKNEPRLIAVN